MFIIAFILKYYDWKIALIMKINALNIKINIVFN